MGGELPRVLDGATSAAIHTAPAVLGAEISSAATRYRRPLTVAVTGRRGTGRDTMARALRQRLQVGALGPGEDLDAVDDADLWVHIIVSAPRPADHAILADLPADRTIIVLGKADTYPDPQAAAAAAADAAHHLGRPVLAVSALLACADVTESEWTFLCDLADTGRPMPSMSGQFLIGDPGSHERAIRLGLLRRLDRFGIDTALELLAAGAPNRPDEAALTTTLHRLSGIDAVRTLIAERVEAVRHWRVRHVRERLDDLAASGVSREPIEQLLRVDEVAG